MKRRSSHNRRGITLIEVMLALGIFLISGTAIMVILTNGVNASVQSRLKTQAVLRSESILSEILATSDLMQSSADVPFEDDPNWVWSLDVNPGPQTDLLELILTVRHDSDSSLGRVSTSLKRYVRDPQIYVDAALAAESSSEEEEEEEL